MDSLDCALDLLRRLPPSNILPNFHQLLLLMPESEEELRSSVDLPLVTTVCEVTGRPFIQCDYNRDGNAFRSPFSNIYQPKKLDGFVLSETLLRLERELNDAFAVYKDLYYGISAVSSVYLWDLQNAFAAAVLIKKDTDVGAWNSTHVIEINDGPKVLYKLTSTVMLTIKDANNTIELGGSLTRQTELETVLGEGHVVNVGRLVEEMEIKIRSLLMEVYFGKTKDVLNDLRAMTDLKVVRQQRDVQAKLLERLQERNK